MGDDSQSSIDFTQYSHDLSLDTTQLTQESQESSQDDTTENTIDLTENTMDLTDDEGRSHARNVTLEKPISISFVTDNAKDITKAIKGFYEWLGCAAHHINLVMKDGFKKEYQAAKLLKKKQKNCIKSQLLK